MYKKLIKTGENKEKKVINKKTKQGISFIIHYYIENDKK